MSAHGDHERQAATWVPYRKLGRGLLRAPGALVFGQSGYERVAPALEVLEKGAYLLGKWRGAAEKRVLFF